MSEAGKQKLAWKKDERVALRHRDDIAAYVANGRLRTKLPRFVFVLFVFSFAMSISVPTLYQAWVERREGKEIQILHLAKDALITPAVRAHSLQNRLDSLNTVLQKGHWEDSSAIAWEDLAQTFRSLSQEAQMINRHITLDSTHRFMQSWNALHLTADSILNRVDAGQTISTELLKAQIAQALENTELQSGGKAWFMRSALHLFEYTLFNNNYLRAWEKQTEDDSRLANTTRPWLQMARYAIFNDLGHKAVPGENGWVFYRPGIEYAVMPLPEEPVRAIVDFRDQLREWDVELLVVPVPNKETVYPDLLNPGANPEFSGKVSPGETLLDSLRARGIAVVDLYQAFARERRENPEGEKLYLRDDTHWRLRGLKIAAEETHRALLAEFDFSPRSPVEYITSPCEVSREGDISAMTKLPEASFFGFRFSFPPETVPCEQVFAVKRDSSGQILDSILYRDDFRRAQILILGDSFSRIYESDAPRSAGWIAHLASRLGEPVVSLVSEGGASTLVRERLARRPGVLRGKKVVIWEFVERDYRFGDSGWKPMELKK